MTNVKVIAIDENPKLIAEANELLLRTDQSFDIDDNKEIDSMIEKILNYIQESEAPIVSKIKNEYENNLQSIQLVYYRPSTDVTVKKLLYRQREIRERYKVNVSKIYVERQKINVFYEED